MVWDIRRKRAGMAILTTGTAQPIELTFNLTVSNSVQMHI
jgi:hypothetical protein